MSGTQQSRRAEMGARMTRRGRGCHIASGVTDGKRERRSGWHGGRLSVLVSHQSMSRIFQGIRAFFAIVLTAVGFVGGVGALCGAGVLAWILLTGGTLSEGEQKALKWMT